MQSFPNYIDRLGLVKAELKCDREPSTLDVAKGLIKRCQSIALIVTATPTGSKGSLGRGERANLTIQGQLRAFHKTEVGLDPTIRQKDELASGKRAKRLYFRQNIWDRYGRTAGCPGCVGVGQHTVECRARIEQEMVDKSDAIKLETPGNQEEIVQEPGTLVSQIVIQAGRQA